MRIEPAPSEPIAPATIPAATAAAAPPLEPPGVCSRCQGLRVAPKASVSEKCHWPTSGALVLPTTIAPGLAQAADRLGVALGGAVLAGAAERRRVAGEVDVVLDRHRHPEQRRALAGGRRRSAASASASAPSAQTTRKAFSVGCVASICSSDARSARGADLSLDRAPACPTVQSTGRWAEVVRLDIRPSAGFGGGHALDGDAGAAAGGEGDGAAGDALVGAVPGTQATGSRTVCSTIRISKSAKLAPRQRRMPPPKGSHS